jgi:lysophospholipid acyltransferase
MRLFYYSGWCITDGAMIASGLAYAGKDKNGEEKFDHIYGINIYEVEFGLSAQIMMQHWNHQIHLWLKHYVYNRTLVKGQKPGLMNNMAVFICSAFWHGFYPFYYVMFFFCALLGELSKDIYRSRVFFRWIPYPLNSFLAK